MPSQVRLDSGFMRYNASNTSQVPGSEPKEINKMLASVAMEDVDLPLYAGINQGDVFRPLTIAGEDNTDPVNLTKKLDDYSNSGQWDAYTGGTTNIMVAILLYLMDKLFKMFGKLVDDQIQQNGQFRLLNIEFAGYAAELGMELALKSFEQSKKAAFIELGAAIAGTVIALASQGITTASISKSNNKAINQFEVNMKKMDLYDENVNKKLDQNKELFKSSESKFRQLKPQVDDAAAAAIEKKETDYTKFAGENKKNINTAYNEMQKRRSITLVKKYNKELVDLKIKNTTTSNENTDLKIFNKQKEFATPANDKLNQQIDAAENINDFTPQKVFRYLNGKELETDPDNLKKLKEFTENGQISIFSKSENEIILPVTNDDSLVNNNIRTFNVYGIENGRWKAVATFKTADSAEIATNFDNLYNGKNTKNGLNDILYVNKNADKLASILSEPDAKNIIGDDNYNKLKESAINTYSTLKSAEVEREGIKKVMDSFADAKPGANKFMPSGKLATEIEQLKNERFQSSQNLQTMAQTINSFSTSLSALINVFGNLANAEANYDSSLRSIFSDMLTTLIQSSKETSDAVANNLQNILINVAKILEFNAAVVQATKVN